MNPYFQTWPTFKYRPNIIKILAPNTKFGPSWKITKNTELTHFISFGLILKKHWPLTTIWPWILFCKLINVNECLTWAKFAWTQFWKGSSLDRAILLCFSYLKRFHWKLTFSFYYKMNFPYFQVDPQYEGPLIGKTQRKCRDTYLFE